jgi:hypothetical protein
MKFLYRGKQTELAVGEKDTIADVKSRIGGAPARGAAGTWVCSRGSCAASMP